MIRKSPRLESSGYYSSDGQPVISYKETPYRKLWTRSRAQQRPRRVATDDAKDDAPLSGSAVGDVRRAPGRNRVLRLARNYLIPICIPIVWILCEPFIRQMTGAPAPSNLLSGRGNELLEEVYGKYNELKALLHSYEELMRKDDKAPLWATVPNYALQSAGARVLCSATSPAYKVKTSHVSILGLEWDFRQAVRPRVVIEGKSELNPGNCWAFAGQRGNLTVALSHAVHVTSVTLGHIAKSISPTGDIPHAPKEFSVYGLASLESPAVKLGSFKYAQNGPMFQNFRIADKGAGASTHVTLSVHSNWGDPTYTCLYSFKVHGRLPS
ncbi:SUN domain-containing protein 1-like [Hippocampus zosterae]|uniref:SUN domain-containing protein 1-like n=1 Tax=Hippocampus zosterae TaxID=109293 RepID=UPI00223E81A0|nr:SUN domain-containing protein 1-like [Hippocampus zosterae]